MPSPNSISVEKLSRLIGRPDSPVLIDVCTEEDFSANPRLIPGAVRRAWADVPAWGPEFVTAGKPAVVICKKGLKLSQGVAAAAFREAHRFAEGPKQSGSADSGATQTHHHRALPFAGGHREFCRIGPQITGQGPGSRSLGRL